MRGGGDCGQMRGGRGSKCDSGGSVYESVTEVGVRRL